MQQHAERFDDQAATFDDRKGLAPEVAQAVAEAVAEASAAGPDDLVVEVGAGTGEIGCHLAGRVRYLGIDSSKGMLDVFRARLGPTRGDAELVEADADGEWPVASGTAAAVFASRAAHLLDPEHLVAELHRVCRPGGVFLVGRVQRDPDGLKSRLRRRRRQLLAEHGVAPRSGEDAMGALFALLEAVEATRLPERTVATWTTRTSAAEVLAAWEANAAMGGVEPPAPVRAAVLAGLRQWAGRELGDLARPVASTEAYVLTGAVLAEEPWTTPS